MYSHFGEFRDDKAFSARSDGLLARLKPHDTRLPRTLADAGEVVERAEEFIGEAPANSLA
jgi:hypothetical protein